MAVPQAPTTFHNLVNGLSYEAQLALFQSLRDQVETLANANAPDPVPPFDATANYDHDSVRTFLKLAKDVKGYKGGVSGDPAIWLKKVESFLEIAECNGDTARIVAVSTLFQGAAEGWFEYLKLQGTVPGAFTRFKQLFIKVHQPVDPTQLARDKISELKQTASVMVYTNEFRESVRQIQPRMTDEEQRDKYWKGLKTPVWRVLKAMSPLLVNTIEKLQENAEMQDNLYWQLEHPKGKPYKGGYGGKLYLPAPTQQFTAYIPPRSVTNGAVPMDIDAIQAAPPQGYGKLTPALKLQLMKEGKCFYCRTGQHRAAECPFKKKRIEENPNGFRQ